MRLVLSIGVLLILASCGHGEPCCTVEISVAVPDDTGDVYDDPLVFLFGEQAEPEP